MCSVPFNIPGGNPPTEDPGLRPRLPVIIVAPVLVMDEPAKSAKPDAPAGTTIGWTTVWRGITVGLVSLFFLQPANRTTTPIATMVNSFFVFILCFLVFAAPRNNY